jgi:hypothetical protein
VRQLFLLSSHLQFLQLAIRGIHENADHPLRIASRVGNDFAATHYPTYAPIMARESILDFTTTSVQKGNRNRVPYDVSIVAMNSIEQIGHPYRISGKLGI